MSYSHDSEHHRDRVFQLMQRLRKHRLDSHMGRLARMSDEDWCLQHLEQITRANFVLMICSSEYHDIFSDEACARRPTLSGSAPSAQIPGQDGCARDERKRACDELARIFHDGDTAKLIVRNSGFPKERIPSFSTPVVFWHKVVEDACSGTLRDGLWPILKEAARWYPNNEVLAYYRPRAVRGIVSELGPAIEKGKCIPVVFGPCDHEAQMVPTILRHLRIYWLPQDLDALVQLLLPKFATDGWRTRWRGWWWLWGLGVAALAASTFALRTNTVSLVIDDGCGVCVDPSDVADACGEGVKGRLMLHDGRDMSRWNERDACVDWVNERSFSARFRCLSEDGREYTLTHGAYCGRRTVEMTSR